MGEGDRARLKALADNEKRAKAIGHAVLELLRKDQPKVFGLVLDGLDEAIAAWAKEGRTTDGPVHSKRDLMRVMHQIGVASSEKHSEAVADLIRSDMELSVKQRAAAQQGRDTRRDEAEYTEAAAELRRTLEAKWAARAANGTMLVAKHTSSAGPDGAAGTRIGSDSPAHTDPEDTADVH